MSKKCTTCNGCCDIIWKEPRRFFHCAFCDIYYDIVDGAMAVINPDSELKKHLELIIEQEEKVINERSS